MGALSDIVWAQPRRDELVAASVTLIESHVGQRRGLRAAVIRTALKTAKAARPDILPRATRRLLPQLIEALEPLHDEFLHSQPGGEFRGFLNLNDHRAVAAMLAVSDRQVLQASRPIQSVYRGLRGMAEEELKLAMPAITELIATRLTAPD